MENFSLEVTGPRTTSAVSWNIWNEQQNYSKPMLKQYPTSLFTKHILNKCRRARKPDCREQNARTIPTSGRLIVDYHSSWRCSCMKDFYSARPASTSMRFSHLFSSIPFNSNQNNWTGTWSSLPMRKAGQKMVITCPMFHRTAKVNSK